jgi:hypothetical protein
MVAWAKASPPAKSRVWDLLWTEMMGEEAHHLGISLRQALTPVWRRPRSRLAIERAEWLRAVQETAPGARLAIINGGDGAAWTRESGSA